MRLRVIGNGKRPGVRFYAISDYAIPVTLADLSGGNISG